MSTELNYTNVKIGDIIIIGEQEFEILEVTPKYIIHSESTLIKSNKDKIPYIKTTVVSFTELEQISKTFLETPDLYRNFQVKIKE